MVNIASRRVPINDGYETCERTYAELRIYGDDLNPDNIAELIGLESTSSQKKGMERINSLGRKYIFKLGGWFLSSEKYVQSKDVRRHLDWLLERLAPVKNRLFEIQEAVGITMNVNCIWWSAFGDGGPTLWPEQMQTLAELNLELVFDISFYGESEESCENGMTKTESGAEST
ncbi:MAG: DUF4279 domain-containing protein [Candidatus Riflebacteria bacterium]|nr:DUF4279 domain-containing protein [Candidatus Riflebacteria bacterium]